MVDRFAGQRVARALSWGQRLIFVATCLTLLEFSEHREKADFDGSAELEDGRQDHEAHDMG